MPNLQRNDEELALLREAARVLPGGTLGNLRLDDDYAFIVREGRGSHIWDVSGNEYVDFLLGSGPMVLGHAHPAVVSAVREQTGTLMHGMGDVPPSGPRLDLLERLCALAPWGEARAVLASTGSEAIEIALKTAQVATGRPGCQLRNPAG